MHTVAERVEYAELLEGIPSLSRCSKSILEKFVAYDVLRAHCAAGEVLCGLQGDHNLYVLTSGRASLHVGNDIVISLEPGDYFGQDSHKIGGTVIADTNAEVLVIGPQDLAQLELASSASRHPSRLEWPMQRSTATQRRRRLMRRSVLTHRSV
ncbi:MAG TPA: cyclic nucleotide-binding domain-containing protein [Acidimicrobiales bacterium]